MSDVFIAPIAAAREAGYSIRHFRRFILDGAFPLKKMGRKWFILRTDFDAWKAAHVPSARKVRGQYRKANT